MTLISIDYTNYPKIPVYKCTCSIRLVGGFKHNCIFFASVAP